MQLELSASLFSALTFEFCRGLVEPSKEILCSLFEILVWTKMMVCFALLGWAVLAVHVFVADAQSVQSEESCVDLGAPFIVSFEGAGQDSDWIALVPQNNPNIQQRLLTQSDYLDWAYKCGSSPCNMVHGRTILSNSAPEGDYVAVLAHGALQPPYRVFAMSPPFRIGATCTSTSLPSTSVSFEVSAQSYALGQPIIVRFENHQRTLPDDFVAIYPASAPASRLGIGRVWNHLCNTKVNPCVPPLVHGQVVFDNPDLAWAADGWPLTPGSYRAYLLRNVIVGGGWVVLQQSELFSVLDDAAASIPTAPPTQQVVPTTSAPTPPMFPPSFSPISEAPFSSAPTAKPTKEPTKVTPAPTAKITALPSAQPTFRPTVAPSRTPTLRPTKTPTFAPTFQSTTPPTFAPTTRPTGPPTMAPTSPPTRTKETLAPISRGPSPTSSPGLDPADNLNPVATAEIAAAREEIESLIEADSDLAPKFLRLIFHDCLGGCDGMCSVPTTRVACCSIKVVMLHG